MAKRSVVSALILVLSVGAVGTAQFASAHTLEPAVQATAASPGPGGPILVVTGSGSAFGAYDAEILQAEGLDEYSVADISSVTAATLSSYDVVVLGAMSLSTADVTMLTAWVDGGGNLIAMRPDVKLAGLLGLTPAAGTLSDAYLKVDTSSGPGVGIVGQTIQYHGAADRYALNGATTIASLYANATTATSNPAVTLNAVGGGGGSAAAFTYDLPRSVVYTRQGNPAWAGQERDGQTPIRSDDLFFGGSADDPQADWVDLSKVAIPQADEQQRLLANLITKMESDRMPLPRFWYFPSGARAVVVMTGDDHGNGGTAGRFNAYLADSPPGCVVADWQCVRSTSYIYPGTPLTSAQATNFTNAGFEVALHTSTGCSDYTTSSLASDFTDQLASLASQLPNNPAPVTNRTHCIAWSDWVGEPKAELSHGIHLDANYYYWPGTWITDRPGMFTGSGMPMRFADTDGSVIDVYQAATQMTDESDQSYPATIDALLDGAVGAHGYYGAFTANMHTDNAGSPGSDAIVASAQADGVPIVSSKQMLTWLDGRNSSSFGSLAYSAGTLSFTVSPGVGARNLQAMVPTATQDGQLASLTVGGAPVGYTRRTVKGIEYAFFTTAGGSYVATYAPDTTAPHIAGVAAVPHAGGSATVTWTTDEASDSTVHYGTSPGSLSQSTSDAALVTAHSVDLSGLTGGTTYYYDVTSTDAANNSATSPSGAPNSFTPPSATLVDTTVADFSAGTGDAFVGQAGDGEVELTPTVGEEFSGSALPADWSSFAWAPGGAATVGGGTLTLDGAFAATNAFFSPGHSIQFVATFGGDAFEHAGLGIDLNSQAVWAIFSTGSDGATLEARTNENGDKLDQPLSSSYLGSPHLYRIDWLADHVDYYIDGSLVASHAIAITDQMRPVASDLNVGGAVLSLDWLHMSPYAATNTFTSRVLDAGQAVAWGTLTRTAGVPAGTALDLSVRTGGTPTPDGSWTAFAPIADGGQIGGSSRYIQYRAAFASDAGGDATPVLDDVTLGFNSTDSSPPTIMLTTPLDGATYTQGDVVDADYACQDEAGGSGLQFCTGSVPDGTPIDTSTIGGHAFTVDAKDAAGNPAEVTHGYTVTAAATPPFFSDGFETGDLSQWTVNHGLVAQQALVASGAWAARANGGSGTVASASKTLATPRPELYLRVRVDMLSAAKNATVTLFDVSAKTGKKVKSVLRLVVTKQKHLLNVIDDVSGVQRTNSVALPFGSWHTIVLHLVAGESGHVDVTLDGAPVGDLTINSSLGTAPFSAVALSEPKGKAVYSAVYDDVAFSTAPITG